MTAQRPRSRPRYDAVDVGLVLCWILILAFVVIGVLWAIGVL